MWGVAASLSSGKIQRTWEKDKIGIGHFPDDVILSPSRCGADIIRRFLCHPEMGFVGGHIMSILLFPCKIKRAW